MTIPEPPPTRRPGRACVVAERFAGLGMYHPLDERAELRLAGAAGRNAAHARLAGDAERGLRGRRGILDRIIASGKGKLVAEVTKDRPSQADRRDLPASAT